MIYTIITYLTLSLAETMILHNLLTSFLTRNKVLNNKYLLGLLGYFSFQIVSYLLNSPLFSAIAFYFIFTVIVAYLFFIDNPQMKITVSSMFVVLNYSCKILAATITMMVERQPMPFLPHSLVLDAAAQILSCLLFLICVFIIIGFRRLRLKKQAIPYTLITYCIPTGTLCIVIKMFYHSYAQRVSALYLDAAGLLLCTALALFYLLDKTVVIDQASEKNVMTEQLLTMQKKYYLHLELSQKEIRSIRHDMKNHMRCILSMLELEENNEAREYIRKIYDDTVHVQAPLSCGNTVIDIILNEGFSKMKDMGFSSKINVILPPNLPIDDVDLCILFGNLMDNAIEACSRITGLAVQKYVDIKTCIKKEYLYVNISNSFNGELRIENDIYQTVKTGERFCGIGLSNVRKVVEKYNGEISIHPSDNVFTVSAMLSLQADPSGKR